MSKQAAILFVVWLLLPLSAQEKDTKTFYVPDGFLSGQDFLQMEEHMQRAYVMGFVDGVRYSVTMGAHSNQVFALHGCLSGMKASQITAIVDKYLKEHPETWHWDAKENAFNALIEVCPELQRLRATAR